MTARISTRAPEKHLSERPALKSTNPTRLFTALLACACLLMAFGAATASATQSITQFSGKIAGPGGEAATQAASHPDSIVTTVDFAYNPDGLVREDPKNVTADVPPGLIGNPTLFDTCSEDQLSDGMNEFACPVTSQVGTVVLHAYDYGPGATFVATRALYNMERGDGQAALFGFNLLGVVVHVSGTVTAEGGDGYAVRLNFKEISQAIPIKRSIFTLWGIPSDPSHDGQRGECTTWGGTCPAPPDQERVPFLTLPSNCAAGAQTFSVRADSWQTPGIFDFASFNTDTDGDPIAFTGCDRVPFDAALTARPETTQADSPTGLEVNLTMPQPQNPDGLATAYLKKAEVTFPEGMSVNPASANGQAGCAPDQIKLGTDAPVSCPDASKIGTVEIESPALDEPLQGSVYLATQGTNPFNSLLALYVAAEGPGVLVKFPGKVTPNPVTGQLVATFDDNPQLPFTSLQMRLKGGDRAPMLTPPTCGKYTTTAKMSPWSASNPDAPLPSEIVISTSSFQISSGPGGSACPADNAFGPQFKAGTVSPIAGAHTPLVVKATRPDGSAPITGVKLDLPRGLLGKLAGIPYCPDAALAAAAAKSGKAELASPSCPAASKVGIVNVTVGAGGSPLNVSGSVYLAGPYKGAPLSLGLITPSVAGPFDLGTVVVRNALNVDPVTAQITSVSDPIPTILQGIPLKIRSIYVETNRDRFTLNPTSCRPMSFGGTLFGSSASRALSSPFQVGACDALGFKPKLSFRYKGETHRSAHPAVTATLKARKGDANIGKAVVTLPETQFLEQGHIRTICTRVQYAADSCPKGSVYGYAKAWSPLLDEPLQGPVVLRSSNNPLPDLVADLNGQIDIDLSGRIDSVDSRMRVTFGAVPDAPVSKFVLRMQGGRKGLLVNNTELCAAKPRAKAAFTGQNGKRSVSRPLVKADCKG